MSRRAVRREGVEYKTYVLALAAACLSFACATLLPTAPAPAFPATATAAPTPAATLRPTRTPAALTPGPTPAADFDDLEPYRLAMLPEHATQVEAFTAATRYYVDVTFTPGDPGLLAGRQRVRYTNPESAPLDDVYFNLYVNTDQFLGEIRLGSAFVNGQPARPQLLYSEAAARLALPEPLAPGASVDIALEWQATVEFGTERGLYRYGGTRGIYAMPSFVPLVPRRVDGRWDIGELPFTGDPVTSDTALFWLRVSAPANLAVAVSGTAIDVVEHADGTRTTTFASGPMRDVALVIGPLQLTRRTQAGVTVNAWLLEDHAAEAESLLAQAGASLAIFSQAIGPYPYNELDFVDVPGFGGIEFPGLIIVGAVGNRAYQEVVVAHETGHQWFYGLIGNDQLREPWLDEGFASYLEILYFESAYSPERGASFLQGHQDDWRRYASDEAIPVGLSVNDYASEEDYFTIVYSKSAAFLGQLRATMGDEAFFDFLRALYDQYRYGFLATHAVERTAEAACACDLADLFDLWVTAGGLVPEPTPTP